MADAPSSIPSRDLARIRQVLARELETINEYEQLARDAESDDIRAFFLHLAEEEKEHVAEAIFLIGNLDSGQRGQFEKDFPAAHFGGAEKQTAREPTPSTAPSSTAGQPRTYLPETHKLPGDPSRIIHALPAPPSPNAGRFTVGPLKGGRD
ncbi:MAG: ferritin [Myxococcaceae bacterium]